MAYAQALKEMSNLQTGPKGALEHKSTLNAIIDLYLKLSKTSYASVIPNLLNACVIDDDSEENRENVRNTIITLLYKRTPRGGEGLRDLPIRSLVYLYDKLPTFEEEITLVILELSEYGRFNDYWRVISIINEKKPNRQSQLIYFEKYNKLIKRIAKNYLNILRKDNKKIISYKKILNTDDNKKPSISWAGKYFPRPKGREDTEIYWGYGIYKEGKLVGMFKLSLTYYLTHLYFNDDVFNNIEGPVKKNKRLPNDTNLKAMRQIYTRLTQFLNVPEVNMSTETWADIDFKNVPSICRFKNSDAFQNKKKKKSKYDYFDEETGDRHPYEEDRIICRQNFIKFMMTTEIKNCKNDPVDILYKMIKTQDNDTVNEKIIEQMWLSLVSETKRNIDNYKKELLIKAKEIHGEDYELPKTKPVIPMIDISPSMDSIAKNKYTCKHIAIALGILASRLNEEPYKNMVLTYSSKPEIINLEDSRGNPYTLRQSYETIMKYCGYTTDLMSAFELLLDVAVKNKIKNEELADMAIFSDMGFDQQFSNYYTPCMKTWNTTQENIEARYNSHNYTTPQIYYANLAKNCGHIQATSEKKGVSQFNTYSSSLFKYIMTGSLILSTQQKTDSISEEIEKKSTEDDFNGMLNQKMFDRIREIFIC